MNSFSTSLFLLIYSFIFCNLTPLAFSINFQRNDTFVIFSVKEWKIDNFNFYLKSFSHVLFCYYMFYSTKFASSIIAKQ